MKKLLGNWKIFLMLCLALVVTVGIIHHSGVGKVSADKRESATNTPQTLPFSQNWTNTGPLLTVNNDWSMVAGIVGYRGDDIVTGTGVDPRTILTNGSTTPVSVLVNQTNPDTFTTGGVVEFDGIPNPTIALNGSGTADVPHIVVHLNTTGLSSILFSCNIRDLDGSADNAIQQIDVQYRVGGTGDYASVPGGYIADATTGPSQATLVTPLNLTLPAAANNQSLVEVRVLTTNAVGNDEAVGVDDISVTGSPAVASEANADFDGDGKTDYTIARDNTPPPAIGTFNNEFFRADTVREKLRIQAEQGEQQKSDSAVPENHGTSISWWIHRSQSNSLRLENFGTAATDFIVPNDYNVNGRDDIAVWRPGAPTVAAFYILNATDNTIREEFFGQTGDDTAITGDYDGDGIADLASYRCPALGSGDGQCFFFYKGSMNNPGGNITYVPWGFGEQFDFFVNPGDFDGDQKFDFCIQRTDPAAAGAGQFVLLKSGGGLVEYINWGRNSDLIVPGDYDGDGKYDFCVSRTETIGGIPGRSYYILERDGGGTGPVSPLRWGIAGDARTPGDYDGDGKTDIAIWRSSVTPGMSNFYVRRSSDGALQTFQWGQAGDFAVPAWVVH